MSSVTFHWFKWVTSNAKLILLTFAISVPIVAYGALGALRSTSNDPRQWLPRGFAETDKYDWFQEQFGGDESAVVSWEGCTLSEPNVERLASALEASPYFDSAMTGGRLLEQLTGPPMYVPRRQALEKLRGVLIGEDLQTSCVVLVTSAAGQDNRTAAVDAIYELAWSQCDLAGESLHLAGPTVDAATIDSESKRLLFSLAGISAILSFVVAAWRLGSLPLATVVLLGAAYSTGLALSVVYYSGGEMNLLMTMLPPLVYVLSISAAVHLANYYKDALAGSRATDAAARAAEHGWLPCLLAALTTSVGLVSLSISKIDPIRTFGFYSAAGVLLSLLVVFLMLPAAFHLLRKSTAKAQQSTPTAAGWAGRVGDKLLELIYARNFTVVTVCLLLLLLGGVGLRSIESTVRLQDRFLPSSPVIADYRWLEENIGPMVPLEIAVHFDKDSETKQIQRLELLESIQRVIAELPERTATLSAANLVPAIPTGPGLRTIVARSTMDKKLDANQKTLQEAGFQAADSEQQLWRISVRANALGSLDYGNFAEKLEARVAPLLAEAGPGVRATFTGIIPLIYKAQRQLLQDLVVSFMTAFGVIALVFLINLRSFPATLLVMVPNLFPAIVVFGCMGLIAVPIQIGSVMTASAALGIAVDDTVHFLTWFRRGLDHGMSRQRALQDAFARCSGAIIHTTLICCGGLAVFVLSTFVPILHFAWLMIFLLVAALIGDLILLPAILAGPAGAVFGKKRIKPSAQLASSSYDLGKSNLS